MFSRLLFATLFVFFVGTNAWSVEKLGGMPMQPKGGFKNEKQYGQWLKDSKNWYTDYSNTLRTLSATLSRKVNEPNLYMVVVPQNGGGQFIAIDKNTARDVTYISYLRELRKYDKPFLQKELASRIRQMLKQSELFKKGVRSYINDLDEMAAYADRQKVVLENELGRKQIEDKKEQTIHQKLGNDYVKGKPIQIHGTWNTNYYVNKKMVIYNIVQDSDSFRWTVSGGGIVEETKGGKLKGKKISILYKRTAGPYTTNNKFVLVTGTVVTEKGGYRAVRINWSNKVTWTRK